MSRPKTVEARHLRGAGEVLLAHSRAHEEETEARAQILEAASARIGGFDREGYFALRGVVPLYGLDLDEAARGVVAALSRCPLPPPLALAALARPEQHIVAQKKAGAWYTDWRLAGFLVAAIEARQGIPTPRILDPACGSGTLLVAAVLHLAGADRELRSLLLSRCVFGSDLDPAAIRGATLALASLTSDLAVVGALAHHLRCGDALVDSDGLWSDIGGPAGPRFDILVGNPPWERLRITRHEHHATRGSETHYGDALPDDDDSVEALREARADMSAYVARLGELYEFQGTGDPDLYKLFTELAAGLLAEGGQLAWLLPGGIIRSQGTAELRRWLLERCQDLRLTVLSNRARFFAVDSRQKVVLVEATVGSGERQALRVRHAEGTDTGVEPDAPVVVGRTALAELRSDLSIPEVRSTNEWTLFLKLARSGRTLADWKPEFCREVDMSLDKADFAAAAGPGLLPLIEGRMVHQYRHDAKRYVSGTGRAAKWDAVPLTSTCAPRPQFWYPEARLSGKAATRARRDRVGFCDITGQTNERAMLAARVPAGFACGNKVPTLLFGDHDDQTLVGDTFLAIANSFAFDWLLRRMVTTTVNFFLLREMPWPALEVDGLPSRRLAELARRVGACAHQQHGVSPRIDPWLLADDRSEIEYQVAEVWGLDLNDLQLIFEDFPLLDRAFAAIRGEPRSTVTRDYVLLRFVERKGLRGAVRAELTKRVDEAKAAGAVPFMPTHLVTVAEERSKGRAL